MDNRVDDLDADIKARVEFVPAGVRSELAQAVAAFVLAEQRERDASAEYAKALDVVRRSVADSPKDVFERAIDARRMFDKVTRDNAAIWGAFFERAANASGFGINRDAVKAYVCGKEGLSLVRVGVDGCVAFRREDGSGAIGEPMKKPVVKVLESFTPPKDPDGDAVADIESAVISALPDGCVESVVRLLDLRERVEQCTQTLNDACDRVGAAYRNVQEAELREKHSISNALAAQERRDQEKKERIAKLRAEADKLEAESQRG